MSGKVRDEYRRSADYRALFPFIKVTMERISFTMRDPIIRKIRMLLVQEQFRDERISEVTTRHHPGAEAQGLRKGFAGLLFGKSCRDRYLDKGCEVLTLEECMMEKEA